MVYQYISNLKKIEITNYNQDIFGENCNISGSTQGLFLGQCSGVTIGSKTSSGN